MTEYICRKCGSHYDEDEELIWKWSIPTCPDCETGLFETEQCRGCEEQKDPEELHRYNGNDYCLPCLAFMLIDDAECGWRAGIINIMQETLGEKFDFDQAFEIVKQQMKEYYK